MVARPAFLALAMLLEGGRPEEPEAVELQRFATLPAGLPPKDIPNAFVCCKFCRVPAISPCPMGGGGSRAVNNGADMARGVSPVGSSPSSMLDSLSSCASAASAREPRWVC